MKKEILKRYFERSSSSAETEAVENWLLDPASKQAFEKFVDEEWEEHTKNETEVVHLKKTKGTAILKIAGIAATLLIAFGIYQLWPKGTPSDLLDQSIVKIIPKDVSLPSDSSFKQSLHVTDTASSFKPNTVQHEKKKAQEQSKILAQVDTTNREKSIKSVPAQRLLNPKVNEAQLAKLIEKIDSNQLVFDVHMSDVAFQQLAYIFRKEYGIILELCSTAGSNKTYTASFKKISIHDLLDDMSEKLAFTYSFQDNKVKICFN